MKSMKSVLMSLSLLLALAAGLYAETKSCCDGTCCNGQSCCRKGK